MNYPGVSQQAPNSFKFNLQLNSNQLEASKPAKSIKNRICLILYIIVYCLEQKAPFND